MKIKQVFDVYLGANPISNVFELLDKSLFPIRMIRNLLKCNMLPKNIQIWENDTNYLGTNNIWRPCNIFLLSYERFVT